MSTQWIKVKAATGGEYEAYLALPPLGKGPGIVLFQEIFGVNRHIRTVAEQYAQDGFVVLAPDVFWRDAPRVEMGYEPADMERGFKLATGTKPQDLVADIGTTIAALRARPEVTGKVGAVGFCMGGKLAYVAAASGKIDAAACYYGGGIQDSLEQAKNVNCPIIFHYAERDGFIPAAAVEKVKVAFAGKKAEFFWYDGADHGFNCWDRGTYQQKSAALARGRTLVHFAQNLA
jgi:carboxymethylenebutenolidase